MKNYGRSGDPNRVRSALTVPVIISALAALAVLGALFPADLAAQASVGPNLRTVPAELTAIYDSQAGVLLTDSVVVRGREIDYGIGFSAGGSGNYDIRTLTGPGGATLQYQLTDPLADGRVVKDLDAPAGAGTLIYGSIRGGGNSPREETHPFALISAPGQYVPAGDYTDTVTVSAYNGNPGEGAPVQEAPMLVRLTVPAIVGISVVSRGEPFDMTFANPFPLSFGVLEQGRNEEVDVVVQTNVNYSLTVNSPNSGVMVLRDAAGDNSVVPYTMRVNGSLENLGAGSVEIATGSATNVGGDRYNLFFEIGNTLDATSGTYEDNLTVTVTAQ